VKDVKKLVRPAYSTSNTKHSRVVQQNTCSFAVIYSNELKLGP